MGTQQQLSLQALIDQLDSALEGEGAGTVDDRVHRAVEAASSWPWPAVDEALDTLRDRYRSRMDIQLGRSPANAPESEALDPGFPALAACLRVIQKRDVKERPADIRHVAGSGDNIDIGRLLKRLRVVAFMAGLLLWLAFYPVEADGVVGFVGMLLLFWPSLSWGQWLMNLDVSGWLSKRWSSPLSSIFGSIWWIGVLVGYIYLIKAVGAFFLV